MQDNTHELNIGQYVPLIINDDFLKDSVVRPESVDLIVTSPPYNLGIGYKSYDDGGDYQEYLKFSKKWLTKALAICKPDGRMCLNIPLDKNKGGHQSIGADLTVIAKKAGWHYHTTIIWNEGNISKGSAWGSWMSASAPYVIAPVELIVVLYKGEKWKKTSGSRISDMTKEEFLEWTKGVWTFSGESKKKIGHPTPFPVELPRRCMKLFSFQGDVVLDPFMGSGSTLIATYQTNRIGVGIDIEKDYCELANNRLLKAMEKT